MQPAAAKAVPRPFDRRKKLPAPSSHVLGVRRPSGCARVSFLSPHGVRGRRRRRPRRPAMAQYVSQSEWEAAKIILYLHVAARPRNASMYLYNSRCCLVVVKPSPMPSTRTDDAQPARTPRTRRERCTAHTAFAPRAARGGFTKADARPPRARLVACAATLPRNYGFFLGSLARAKATTRAAADHRRRGIYGSFGDGARPTRRRGRAARTLRTDQTSPWRPPCARS